MWFGLMEPGKSNMSVQLVELETEVYKHGW